MSIKLPPLLNFVRKWRVKNQLFPATSKSLDVKDSLHITVFYSIYIKYIERVANPSSHIASLSSCKKGDMDPHSLFFMVGREGIEPPTRRASTYRSSS